MRKIWILTLLALLALLAFPASAICQDPTVHHIVLFDLKDDVTEAQMNDMISKGEELLAQIPGVLDVSIGYLAREDRAVHIKDYDLAMYVLWENNGVGDVYAPHEHHQAYLAQFKPLVERIQVIDFFGN